MTRLRALALALPLLLAGCGPSAPPGSAAAAPTAAGATDDIARVLDDWHDAAAKADETRYFEHFATGGVFLGTDGKERWTVPEFRAYAHPHFAKGKAWSFRSTRREVTRLGDVAWFDEDLDTPNLGPARGSGVLVKERGAWRIAQYNLSVPIPNERFKDVKAIIEGGR
jgi:hypothetical protein